MLALAFLAALPVSAQAAANCTQETLSVRGTPLTVSYCVQAPARAGPDGELVVAVLGSFGGPSGTFSRPSELHFVGGEPVSRVVQDVDLHPAGLDGTLHLTLVLAGGLVRVEGAMLTPGALTLK
ncbi:MAG: hypothetical protein JO199_01295 [Candidatus Eremiobacteraeota bacterium]|nr:hypothetical protein [Candidatus Eremiobacteraeota bacterium]